MTGILYICPTPIGNLEDMTFRAIKTLKEVDIIGAEDTRTSMKLLNHFDIKTKMTSYHKFNEHSKGNYLIEELLSGKNIAIISDAGMPGISDPGSEIISLAIENDIKIEVLPGATASITALVASGLNTDRFLFYGFLESKGSTRRKELESLKKNKETIIFYESPHRIFDTLEDVLLIFGNRKVAICKELTKIHENIIRDTVESGIVRLRETVNKGEYVLIVEGNTEVETVEVDIKSELEKLIDGGYTKKDAIKKVVSEFSIPKNRVYEESLKL
ncbi:MAG: 16S rRNA (cytidine(1402)-2'-O)-methyltransferase [Tissierellia bacterium]|nr:16S rRNA (cytidine(1402)-2'-O)-methyltransferase [Tissierellia bacterium]